MTRERLLTYLVVALTVLNLAVLAVLYTQNMQKHSKFGLGPVTHDENAMNERVKKTFMFDEEQLQAFIISKDKIVQRMRPLKQELNEISKEFYHLSNSESDLMLRDSLLRVIDSKNIEIYNLNIRHFDEIRAICNPDQMDSLDRFIDRLLIDTEGRPGKRRPPPRQHVD